MQNQLRDVQFVERFMKVMVDDHEHQSEGPSNGGAPMNHAIFNSNLLEESIANQAHIFIDR